MGLGVYGTGKLWYTYYDKISGEPEAILAMPQKNRRVFRPEAKNAHQVKIKKKNAIRTAKSLGREG